MSTQEPGFFDHTADRLDDVGIALLASPYLAKALGHAAAKSTNPFVSSIGRGAERYHTAFDAQPLAEVAGLALVAPGVTHTLADQIDTLRAPAPVLPEALKAAAWRSGYADALARLGIRFGSL